MIMYRESKNKQSKVCSQNSSNIYEYSTQNDNLECINSNWINQNYHNSLNEKLEDKEINQIIKDRNHFKALKEGKIDRNRNENSQSCSSDPQRLPSSSTSNLRNNIMTSLSRMKSCNHRRDNNKLENSYQKIEKHPKLIEDKLRFKDNVNGYLNTPNLYIGKSSVITPCHSRRSKTPNKNDEKHDNSTNQSSTNFNKKSKSVSNSSERLARRRNEKINNTAQVSETTAWMQISSSESSKHINSGLSQTHKFDIIPILALLGIGKSEEHHESILKDPLHDKNNLEIVHRDNLTTKPNYEKRTNSKESMQGSESFTGKTIPTDFNMNEYKLHSNKNDDITPKCLSKKKSPNLVVKQVRHHTPTTKVYLNLSGQTDSSDIFMNPNHTKNCTINQDIFKTNKHQRDKESCMSETFEDKISSRVNASRKSLGPYNTNIYETDNSGQFKRNLLLPKKTQPHVNSNINNSAKRGDRENCVKRDRSEERKSSIEILNSSRNTTNNSFRKSQREIHRPTNAYNQNRKKMI